MKVQFRKTFKKDLAKLKNRKIKQQIKAVIEQVESANSLTELKNVKAMQGQKGFYRIRVGDYRMGLYLESDIVAFVRILPRKEIYRYFP